jgi:6-phosphofructokinase 2
MSAILTITFNPALDKSFSTKELLPGRKLPCTKPVFEAGGGGINVARAIKLLGGDVTALFLAGGPNGEELSRILDQNKVPFFRVAIKGATRENVIVSNYTRAVQYLFDLPGPAVTRAEWERCLEVVRQTSCRFIVVSGSLPPGVPLTIYRDIAAIAYKKNAKLIVDASGPALQAALDAGIFLIKPNLREITTLAGLDATETAAATAAQRYIADGHCSYVMVSLGASGALLAGKDNIVHIHSPHTSAKSTVGAGDCLLAGLVLALSQNKTIEEAAVYGVACGTAAILNEGTAQCRKTEAKRLYGIMKYKQIHPSTTKLNTHESISLPWPRPKEFRGKTRP